jgi:hypothetical protein
MTVSATNLALSSPLWPRNGPGGSEVPDIDQDVRLPEATRKDQP